MSIHIMVGWYLIVDILFSCIALSYTEFSFPFTQSIKENFEETFHNTCDKYPFVEKWYRLLENPGERYIMFVFQDNGLKNGGLGDRFAGLITATVDII